jgi:N-acetylglutamate synthase-like GNAT family acetyltransferase
MLDRAAASAWTKIAEWDECFLIAYLGEDPVGIAGLQTEVDAALMGAIFVCEQMRQRAIGARLIAAVRRAAHGRGARTLYAIAPGSLAGYFVRQGFAEATDAELHKAFGLANLHCCGMDLEKCRPLRLDLSQEGFKVR